MIRRATFEDIDGAAEVLVAAWTWAYKGVVSDELLGQQQVGPRAQRIRERWDPSALALVVIEDERVVGNTREQKPVGLAGYDVEIGSLYVHPDYARRGYGRLLLRAMVSKLLTTGGKSLCIHTLSGNMIGRGFYERMGGMVVAEDTWAEYPAVWYGWSDMRVILDIGDAKS